MTRMDVLNAKTSELVEFFNAHTDGNPVKRFSSRAAAERRVLDLFTRGLVNNKAKTEEPKEEPKQESKKKAEPKIETVEPTDFNKIKTTISNLLDLSESSNEHEAALAIQKANHLLKKYNLSMAEVRGEEETEIGKKVAIKCSCKWEAILAGPLARYNMAELLFHNYPGTGRGIAFVGTEENVEITMVMFKKLRKHFNHLSRIKFHTPAERNSYLIGAAHEISDRLYDLIDKRKSSESAGNKALVVIQNKAKDYIDNLDGIKTARTQRSRVNMAAYGEGKTDGKSAPIFTEIK